LRPTRSDQIADTTMLTSHEMLPMITTTSIVVRLTPSTDVP
jgi:hypothetical protein